MVLFDRMALIGFWFFNNFFMSCIRYVDGHHQKFRNFPTSMFRESSFKAVRHKRGYVKRNLPDLSVRVMLDHHETLEMLLNKAFMQRKAFKTIKDDLLHLKLSFENFVKHRSDANERVQSRQNLTEPVQVETHLNIIKPCESISDLQRALYKDLESELKKKQHFDPVNLYLFASTDRTKRFRFIHGLKLSIPVAVYRLPKKNMAFVWSVSSTDLSNLTESVNLVKQIDATLPKRHNTEMRGKILQMFKNRSKIEKSELLGFYDLLTENQTIDKEEALDRFQIKINAGVPKFLTRNKC